MSKRKTAQQRIEEYRIKADKLEAAAKRRALRQSPQWKLTIAAADKMLEAIGVLEATDCADQEHLDALMAAHTALTELALDRVL